MNDDNLCQAECSCCGQPQEHHILNITICICGAQVGTHDKHIINILGMLAMHSQHTHRSVAVPIMQPATQYPRNHCQQHVDPISRAIIKDISKLELQKGNNALFDSLNELRIAKKNLVYIIGISPDLADDTVCC